MGIVRIVTCNLIMQGVKVRSNRVKFFGLQAKKTNKRMLFYTYNVVTVDGNRYERDQIGSVTAMSSLVVQFVFSEAPD